MRWQEVARAVMWSLIGLAITVTIDVVAIVLVGYTNPVLILVALSVLTFLEAGPLLILGGVLLMVGGFPSLSMAIRRKWDPKLAKESIAASYTPLLLAGFLVLTSIVVSFFVY